MRPVVRFEHTLGYLGLGLMLALAWLANVGYDESPTRGGRLIGFFARRGIDGIAVIGWLADRISRRPVVRSAHAPRRSPVPNPM
jgi:hypothetical protein